jgi:hypothetical protein
MRNCEFRCPLLASCFQVFIFYRTDRRCACNHHYGHQDGQEHVGAGLKQGFGFFDARAVLPDSR